MATKARIRQEKIQKSNAEIQQVKNKPIEALKTKEFLTVREVSQLLGCSLRSAYLSIELGHIKAVNLGKRMTRVKRSEIDKIFETSKSDENKPQSEISQIADTMTEQQQTGDLDMSQWYSTEEVRQKYGISESGLRNLIIKHSIPKFRKGWYAYIPKAIIQKLLITTDN